MANKKCNNQQLIVGKRVSTFPLQSAGIFIVNYKMKKWHIWKRTPYIYELMCFQSVAHHKAPVLISLIWLCVDKIENLIYKDESLCVCLFVCLLPMEIHTVGPRMLKFCMGLSFDPRQVVGYVSTPGDHP